MSEGDVSLIRDEDLLRRMWQQTEDFSRKKEIRAHMYRLREERLRSLYSPQPTIDGKGCEFTPAQSHVRSFADQTFQSMKSKEVRDAASPPKELVYRGQDLKALSNAGWNVESENKTTDDGHTRVRTVQANIEGKYDVEGGTGQFAAIDKQKQSATEYCDDNSSLKRNESSSVTAAHEQVQRQTDDGTQFSSTTSSSTSTSKFQQVSSSRNEAVPYATNNVYDISRQTSCDTNTNLEESTKKYSSTSDYEQNLKKTDYDQAELVSRKIEYPDENTKIVVETRRLPDGTRVTSTKREFRAPSVQSSHTEQHSKQIRSENKSSFTSSSQKRSDIRETSFNIVSESADHRTDRKNIVDTQRLSDQRDFHKNVSNYDDVELQKIVDDQDVKKTEHFDHRTYNIIDSKKTVDDTVHKTNKLRTADNYDLKKNERSEYYRTQKDDRSEIVQKQTQKQNTFERKITETDRKVIDKTIHANRQVTDTEHQRVDNDQQRINIDRQIIDNDRQRVDIDHTTTDTDLNTPEMLNRRRVTPLRDDITLKEIKTTKEIKEADDKNTFKIIKDIQQIAHNITHDKNIEEVIEKKTTYQTDYVQKKISTDLSPSHQAWASTLRSDTPSTTRPTTRASSPGSRTFISSTSSLRSSVSPDKTYKKPSSRGGSPNKYDMRSPRNTPDRYTGTNHAFTETRTHSYTSSNRKIPCTSSPSRSSASPDRKPEDVYQPRSKENPEKHPIHKHKPSASPERKPTVTSTEDLNKPSPRSSQSPDRKFKSNYPRATSPSKVSTRISPEKKIGDQEGSTIRTTADKFASGKPPVGPQNEKTTTTPTNTTRLSTSPDRRPDPRESSSHFRVSPERTEKKYEKTSDYNRPIGPKNTTPDGKRASPIKDSNNDNNSYVKINHDKTPSSKVKEDHYRFVDEETKMYMLTEKMDITDNKSQTSTPANNFPRQELPHRESPSKQTTAESQSTVTRSTLKKDSRSPSPSKSSVTFTADGKRSQVDETDYQSIVTNECKNITKRYQAPKDNYSQKVTPKDTKPNRASSPSKYGTYEKKCHTEVEDTKITTTIDDEKDKYDSLTQRKSSPKKSVEQPRSPTRKSPRASISPVKSITKETKYSHMTDFINIEKRNEEINKKITAKDRPRQLVTPSTSPTRKSKAVQKAPSTGQSSPTTSVSGFVYFSSPRTENRIVSDLDDQYYCSDKDKTEDTRSSTEDITPVIGKKPPSKLPCRSPSPEKGTPSVKENLPRKSSLKKPSNNIISLSPSEKPPTNFQVSPSNESVDFPEHITVKKDNPDKIETDSTVKPKPPFERRETYEERCKKILGMVDNDFTTKVDQHSPSISPCRSPTPTEDSLFKSKLDKTSVINESTLTDFIKREREDVTKKSDIKTKKTHPREMSPTKLQDIFIQHLRDENPEEAVNEDTKTSDTIKSEKPEHSRTPSPTKRVTETTEYSTEENVYSTRKITREPSDDTPKYSAPARKPEEPKHSRATSPTKTVTKTTEYSTEETSRVPSGDTPKYSSPARKPEEPKHSRTPSPTKTVTKTMEYSTEEDEYSTRKITREPSDDTPKYSSPARKPEEPKHSRATSPTKTVTKRTEYSTEETSRVPSDDTPKYSSPTRKPEEPKHSRTPSPTKTVTKTTEYSTEEDEYSTRRITREPSDDTSKYSSPARKPEEPKHSSTPSPTKTVTKTTQYSAEENEYSTRRITREPSNDTPKYSTPARKPEEPKHSRTPSPTKIVTKTTEYSTEDNEYSTRKTTRKSLDHTSKHSSLVREPEETKHSRTPSPTKTTEYSTEEDEYSTRKITREPSDDTPKYSSPTRKPEEPKHARTPPPTKTVTKTAEHLTEENEYSTRKITREPSDDIPKYSSSARKPEEPKHSRSTSPTKTVTKTTKYSTEENDYSTRKITRKPSDDSPKYSSPARKPEEPKHSRTPSPTKTVTKTMEYSTEENEYSTRKTTREPLDHTPKHSSPVRKPEEQKHTRKLSPTKTVRKTTEYSTEETSLLPSDDTPKYSSPARKLEEPKHSRTPSPTKTVTKTTEYSTEDNEYSTRKTTWESLDHTPKHSSPVREPEEPKHSRTPSPTKIVTKTTEYSTEEDKYSTRKITREPSDDTPKYSSPTRKPEEPKHSRTPSPTKTVTKTTEYSTEEDEYSTRKITREPSDDTPKYSSPARKPEEPKHSRTPSPTKIVTKTTEYSTAEDKYSTRKITREPSDDTPKYSAPARKPEEPKHSRATSPTKTVTKTTEYSTEETSRVPSGDTPKYSSPARKPEEPKHSRTPSPTKTVTKTMEYSTEEDEYSTRKITREPSDDTPKYSSLARKPEEPKHSRATSPTKTVTKRTEYSTEETSRVPSDDTPKYSSPARKPEEPKHSRTPSPTKIVTKTTEYSTEEDKYSTRKITREPSDDTPKYSSPTRKPDEPKHSRTPSPTKKVTKTTEYSTEEDEHSTRKITGKPSDDTPKYSSPARKPETPKHSRTPSPTKTATKTMEYSTEENEYSTRKTTREPLDHTPKHSSPVKKPKEQNHTRKLFPTKTVRKTTEYSTEETSLLPSDDTPKHSSPVREPEEPKHSRTPSPTKTVTKTTEYFTEENEYSTRKITREPSDDTPKYSSPARKPEEPKHSRTPSPNKTVTKTTEYVTEENEYSTRKITREPSDDTPKYSSPARKPEEPKHSRTPSPTKTTKYITEENKYSTRNIAREPSDDTPMYSSVARKPEEPKHSRTPSPTKTVTKATKYSTEENEYSTCKTTREPLDHSPKHSSPERKPEEQKHTRNLSPTKTVTKTTEYSIEDIEYKTRKIDQEPSDDTSKYPTPARKPEEPNNPKELRTSSPTKTEPTKNFQKPNDSRTSSGGINRFEQERSPTRKTPIKSSVIPSTKEPVKPSQVTNTEFNKLTNQTKEFIKKEKDTEISDRVMKSRREPSPNHGTLPSRDRVTEHVNTSLHKLDGLYTETSQIDATIRIKDGSRKIFERKSTTQEVLSSQSRPNDDKPLERQMPTKLPSRNVSPTKKPGYVTPSNTGKSTGTPTKTRSTSPRKTISTFERPQSPQIPRTSILKPKEQIRKPTSPIKSEKISITTETRKSGSAPKQNSFTKTTVIKNGSIILQSNKTTEHTHKGVTKENSFSKIHTSSNKTKLKPDIQVSEISSTKSTRQTTSKIQKPSLRESPNKLTNKPKSATALNASTDDDDVIIDVQQAKSSRENSPDRICPTPINFMDDVGTPRFPDEVSEPDDDFRKRTHHTIHETETIVDDIIEISEEDELFVKRTDVNRFTESDECLLSVNDKVSRFTNKGEPTNKPKNTSLQFIQTEKQVHLDSVDQKLKSDECLLSVSEKVNKFTKGPRDTKDNKSPSRNIVEDYDKSTVYQDDYTKMSVNDKAHLFIETAEKVKVSKVKPSYKVDRPEFDNIDDSLRSDDCLLSVSDKVNKFVKTAEQFLTESQETEDKENKIREQHEKIMRKIVQDSDEETCENEREVSKEILSAKKNLESTDNKTKIKEEPLYVRTKEISSPKKPTEKAPVVKITTLRSSEAVKKAKALFENIASTTQNTKDTIGKNITKLSDLGVVKKSANTDSTFSHHTSVEGKFNQNVDNDNEVDALQSPIIKNYPTNTRATSTKTGQEHEEKSQHGSPNRVTTQSPELSRNRTPIQKTESTTTTKTVLTRYSAGQRPSTSRHMHHEDEIPEKPQDNIPGYLRPTKTSQIRDEIKTTEDSEVSSRRGSGKFGVELRRTSVERSTVSSERRRSVEHHQPCIEDIFDIDLLEQMLEKVVGYEQRRRIRAQIRIAKKGIETELIDTNTYTKSLKQRTVNTPKSQSPDRQSKSLSQKTVTPDRKTPISTPQKTASPDRVPPRDVIKPVTNTPVKEVKTGGDKRQRTHSPEKSLPKPTLKTRSPARQLSSEKITKTQSPIKIASPKPKTNRFNEYATAYMKKVGLNEMEKNKINKNKIKTASDVEELRSEEVREHKIFETKSSSISKTHTERTSSKDIIEVEHLNGKRSPSPEKKHSPERKPPSPIDRLHQRSPSPDFKRPKAESYKKEIIIKTVHDEKKIIPKLVEEERPSWVTNRNLKKITSETRTFSNKKIETEKPKYRAPSPSKVITKPIDVITSSYGPGPLDADGRPLFGIKALRNGATNYQVRGTVVREEYHSRNGSAPQGSVSVTAYSSQPEELERLLAAQGERPSRLHGLAAITTTKKFGGDTGTTYTETRTKEERAALDHFTKSDRRVTESRVEDVMQYCTVRDIAARTISDTPTEMRIEDVTEYKSVDSKRGQRKGDGESRGTVTSREQRGEDLRGKRGEKVDSKRGQTERAERREDKQTVRQSSVKSLTEKYIKSASQAPRADRAAYPKAGLILRSASLKDNLSSDSETHAGVARSGSERSLCSDEGGAVAGSGARPHERSTTTTTTTAATSHHRAGERSFLDSSTKVTGVQDILTRMKNADIVIEDGDSCEDSEARALLNKFLGATVLMAGMQGHMADQPAGKLLPAQESVRSSGGTGTGTGSTRGRSAHRVDVDQCWDERVLNKLLEECTDYEQRRQLRARIRTLMAEQEACATAVTEALAAAGETAAEDETAGDAGGEAREETSVTITSSVRRDSSENTVSSSTTTKTSKVIESMTRSAPKPVSPFAKFRQLEKQNSTNSTNSKGPGSPRASGTPATPGAQSAPGSPASPVTGAYFRFTEPALQAGAATIKERLLQWCRDKTRDYENVKLENFSTSWADGLAFCALLHHFLPDAFDYSQLTADKRRHNFTLAFTVADEKAGIYPLLDVEDMVAMRRPDWKCVFTYVQAIHRRFKDAN